MHYKILNLVEKLTLNIELLKKKKKLNLEYQTDTSRNL